jgi:hypothetical protein
VGIISVLKNHFNGILDIKLNFKKFFELMASFSQQPMIVEENHTQLIKQEGQPTRIRVKETLSEIHSEQETPQVRTISLLS